MSPPGGPGAAVFEQHSTVVTVVAAGAVSDYTEAKTDQIAQVFADNAGVTRQNVIVTVSAGSVVIQAKIIVTSAAAATAVNTQLSSSLATPTTATNFFSAVTGGVTVTEVPVIVTVVESVVAYPPPPAPGDSGLDGGAIAGIVVGCVAFGAIVVLVALKMSGKMGTTTVGGGSSASSSTMSGVQFTSAGKENYA